MKAATLQLDFDQLFALKQFADNIRLRQVAALDSFRDTKSESFRHRASSPDKSEISMSSTATCVSTLVDCGLWEQSTAENGWKNFPFLTGEPFWKDLELGYIEKLLVQEWSSAGLPANNAFTVAFVIEACANLLIVKPGFENKLHSVQKVDHKVPTADAVKLDPMPLEALLKRAARLVRDALLARDSAPQDRDVPVGAVAVLDYPPNAYLTVLAARALDKLIEVKPEYAPDGYERRPIGAWAMNEISSQLALIKAGSNAGDPLILAYAVICAARYRPSTERTPVDNELIRFGLETFFACQKENGGWPQSQPLFHYPSSGSAYCYDYELLAELMATRELFDILFEFIPQIERATLALDKTKFELPNGTFGWASNQRSQHAGPESWSTGCVYLFLHRLDRFLAEAIRQTIADELETTYTGIREPGSAGAFAEKFLDCPFSAVDLERSLKDEIFHRLVEPLQAGRLSIKAGQKLPKNVKVSAILFGPPGTSKTEIVDQIASFVGWPTVTVDPSYFVKNGLDAIQAQANRIFRMLATAEQMVVLFDEFDEMVRNRAESEDILSRFLTTAMLPKLAKINKERRILFIVATNYIKSFDIAISRPGRFDLIFQMMPPMAALKLKHPPWARELGWLKTVVGDGFDDDLGGLTYLETDKLVSRLRTNFAEETKDRDQNIARSMWKEAVAGGTLARPHEQRERKEADQQLKGMSPAATDRFNVLKAKAKETSPDRLTWGEVAVLETAYIREE